MDDKRSLILTSGVDSVSLSASGFGGSSMGFGSSLILGFFMGFDPSSICFGASLILSSSLIFGSAVDFGSSMDLSSSFMGFGSSSMAFASFMGFESSVGLASSSKCFGSSARRFGSFLESDLIPRLNKIFEYFIAKTIPQDKDFVTKNESINKFRSRVFGFTIVYIIDSNHTFRSDSHPSSMGFGSSSIGFDFSSIENFYLNSMLS